MDRDRVHGRDLHDRVVQEFVELANMRFGTGAEPEARPELANDDAGHADPLRAVQVLDHTGLASPEVAVSRGVETDSTHSSDSLPEIFVDLGERRDGLLEVPELILAPRTREAA